MNFQDAFEKMQQGEVVEHGGRNYKMHGRALYEIIEGTTDPKRVPFKVVNEEAWASLVVPPEPVAPEAVDDALAEVEHEDTGAEGLSSDEP